MGDRRAGKRETGARLTRGILEGAYKYFWRSNPQCTHRSQPLYKFASTSRPAAVLGPRRTQLQRPALIYLHPYWAPARHCTPADCPRRPRALVESVAEHPRRWRPSQFSPTTATTTLLRPRHPPPPPYTRSSPPARSPPRPRICPHPSHPHTRIALLPRSYSQSETPIRAHLGTSKTRPIRAPAR